MQAGRMEGDMVLKCISSIHLEKCCLVFWRVIPLQNAHQLTHKTEADAIPISFRIARFFQRALRSPLKVPFEVTFCTKPLLVIWRRHDFMSEWDCTPPLGRAQFPSSDDCFVSFPQSSNTYIVRGETESIHCLQKTIHLKAAGRSNSSACPLHSWMSFVQSLGLGAFSFKDPSN